MRKLISNLTLATAIPLAFAACGSNVPTIEDVKQNFQSPSGSTSDKDTVVAAQQKQSSSSPAMRVAGNGTTLGFGLSAAGKAVGIERLQATRMFNNEVRQLKAIVDGASIHSLTDAEATNDACSDSAAVQDAFRSLVLEAALTGSGSSSFSYSVDVANCTNNQVTGSMSVNGEIELSQSAFKFTIEQALTNVCEQSGQKACVDGTFVIEMAAENTGGAASKFEFTTALFAKATWEEGGKQLSAETKGGMRLAADNQSAALEILVYVKNRAGEESTFVLKATAKADGSATLEVRGKDGSLTCNISAEGAGECTAMGNGGAAVSWTRDEALTIAADEALMSY